MKHIFESVTNVCRQAILVILVGIALTVIGQAQLITQATYNAGNYDELDGTQGPGKQRPGCNMVETGTNPNTAALMIVDSPSVSGKAMRHQVKGCSERAETVIRNRGNVLNSSTPRTYWYRWNLYLPTNWQWGGIFTQFPAYPVRDSNLVDLPGRRALPCVGAGSDIRINTEDNRWEFTFQHSNGSTGEVRSVCEELPLGSVQRGTWTTFVMHVKWTGNSDGFIKIWQNNVLKVNKTNVRTFWNDEDEEPYFKNGYYTGDPQDDGSVRILYTDESRVYGDESTLNDVCPTCEGGTTGGCSAAGLPNPPSNLTATATQSGNQITLSWTDHSNREELFKIERSTDNVTFAQVATVGANVTTYTDTPPAAGTYYYRVRANNCRGDSAFSNTAQAGISAPPPSNSPIVNPGFEDETPTQTPAGWQTWSPDGSESADYTESYGGAHGGLYHGTHWMAERSYEVYSYQTFNNLENGTYRLRAFVKGSGGQQIARMEAKRDQNGGAEVAAAIPATNQWTPVELQITVTNGTCTIGFYSVASAGQWIYFDSVEFNKQQ